jgi:hypothetical protein
MKEKIHMKFHSDRKLTGEYIQGKAKHLFPKSRPFPTLKTWSSILLSYRPAGRRVTNRDNLLKFHYSLLQV